MNIDVNIDPIGPPFNKVELLCLRLIQFDSLAALKYKYPFIYLFIYLFIRLFIIDLLLLVYLLIYLFIYIFTYLLCFHHSGKGEHQFRGHHPKYNPEAG